MSKKVLVTGGLGYIGSHTVVELIQEGYDVVIVDDLSNASLGVLENIVAITAVRPVFYQANVCDKKLLMDIFMQHRETEAVIHFAAFKAVGESVKKPLKYYRNNLDALITVLECMDDLMTPNFIFSSSATVYGHSGNLPVTEETPMQKSLSAYGSTKQMGEDICEKVCSTGLLNAAMLRYFNPVGAHESGLLGELPSGTPNNLMPYLTQVAKGKLQQLTVYGNNYPTNDGTCIRDYIHVVDLAKAHVASCRRLLQKKQAAKFEVFNIGTGNPVSVLELVHTFEKVNNIKVPYVIGERRAGDTPVLYADVVKAATVLGWIAKLNVEDMVGSAWNFEQQQALKS
jgi:UDP-glucose 4-epimerase